eukprot:5718854-Prymnesium_polylepis.1
MRSSVWYSCLTATCMRDGMCDMAMLCSPFVATFASRERGAPGPGRDGRTGTSRALRAAELLIPSASTMQAWLTPRVP